MTRDITAELEEFGAEKADELWDGGDVPTTEEFGEFLGYCVAKYMEEKDD